MRRAVILFIRATGLAVALLLVLAGTAAFIMNTESGTRWVLARIGNALPGSLEFAEFEGTLWRGLAFPSASYRDANVAVAADELEFSIDWATLPAARLTITNLDAGGLRIHDLAPAPGAPKPLALSMEPLPVDISLVAARVARLEVGRSTAPVVLQDVDITDLRGDGLAVRARSIAATTSGVTLTAARLTLRLAGDLPLSAGLRWRLVDGPWSGEGPVRGAATSLDFDQQVDGPYPGYATGTLTLPPGAQPELDVLVNWHSWTFAGVDVVDGEARVGGWLDGFVAGYDATLVVAPGDTYAIDGTADGSLDRIDAFAATLDGALGHADLSGTVLLRPDVSADFRFAGAGEFRGSPLAARGRIQASARSTRCVDCAATLGDNTLVGDVSLAGGTLDGTFELSAPKLEQLFAGASGGARGTGSIAGTPDDPLLTADLAVRELRIGQGPMPPLDVQTALRLQRDADGVRADIRRATITEAATGEWVLEDPFGMRVAAGLVAIDPHRWTGGNGEIRIAGFSMTPAAIEVAATVAGLPLQLAQPWLPANARLLGTGSADVDLTRADGRWSGTIDWRQSGTLLRVTQANGDVTDVVVPTATMRATLRDGGLDARAALAIEPGMTGELRFGLAALAADTAMTAELRLGGDDWGWVSAVLPQVDRFEGSVAARVTASGPLRAPEFDGDLRWQDGRLLIPALNVPFTDIDVVVSGASAGSATLRGSAKAGNGTLSVEGRFQDLMRPERSAELRITGKNAELVNWPEYHVWGSPDMTISGDPDGWRFAGRLELPRADISVRKMPEEAVTVSPDVIVLGEERDASRDLRIEGEATLALGERVRIAALGLESQLAGSLLFRIRANRPPAAEGKVTLVDGVFEAYGQKLAISHGELTFTGPLDDPIVDVRAVRVIETIDETVTAGIQLRGRARNLTTSVFAEPAMAEADALSYLVVGRPLNQATEAEGSDLSGAAVALGLRQAGRLTDQIGQAIGLDQLSVTGDGSDSTALVAGKQINPRLHARYAYGVFSRLGSLLLRYRMSKRLTLEAGAGENQSIDILYSVETD